MKEVNMTKFKVGDRVRVLADEPFFSWGRIKKGDVGVVRHLYKSESIEVVVDFPKQDGWYAKARELELVEASVAETPRHRRIFRQLRDGPSIRKGALWQEKDTTGTQNYMLVDISFVKHMPEGIAKAVIARETVETETDWFEEVFEVVEPQYLNKSELQSFRQWQELTARHAGVAPVSRPAKKKAATKYDRKAAWTPERRKAHSEKIKAAMAAKKAA